MTYHTLRLVLKLTVECLVTKNNAIISHRLRGNDVFLTFYWEMS